MRPVAVRGDNYRAFLAQLEKIDASFRRAFEDAVADVRSTTQLRALEAAIERGDIEGALRAIQLGAEFFAPLDRMVSEAYTIGATWQLAQTLPKPGGQAGPLQIRFDGRHPRAEAWNRQAGARLVAEVTDSIRQSVRLVVQDGLEQGRAPRKVALDIAGRINSATGRREGGIVGLTSREAGYVINARRELEELSGAYFQRKLRDKRFDRTVAAAIREGKPLAQADLDRIVGRYNDRLLFERGVRIARTEGLQALNAGRNEGIVQMAERGGIPAELITVVWQSTPDSRTRDTHASLNGQEVQLGEAFVTDEGNRLLHPGDQSFGAPASETINCRCSVRYRVKWEAMAE